MKVQQLFEGKGFKQGDEVELIKDYEGNPALGRKKVDKGRKGTVENTNGNKVIVKGLGSIPADYLKLAEEVVEEAVNSKYNFKVGIKEMIAGKLSTQWKYFEDRGEAEKYRHRVRHNNYGIEQTTGVIELKKG